MSHCWYRNPGTEMSFVVEVIMVTQILAWKFLHTNDIFIKIIKSHSCRIYNGHTSAFDDRFVLFRPNYSISGLPKSSRTASFWVWRVPMTIRVSLVMWHVTSPSMLPLVTNYTLNSVLPSRVKPRLSTWRHTHISTWLVMWVGLSILIHVRVFRKAVLFLWWKLPGIN